MSKQKQKNTFCTQHVLNLYFSGNSMNNLLSHCGLTDARMRASEKDLPVPEFGNSTTELTLTNLLHCKVEMMTFISIALSMVYKKPEFKIVAKSYTLDDPKKHRSFSKFNCPQLFNNIPLNFVQMKLYFVRNLILTASCQDI